MMRNNVSGVVISRQKAELMKAFDKAESINEMLKTFTEMETSFDESDLGMVSMILAIKLVDQAKYNSIHYEQALILGNKALKILLSNVDKSKPCFGKYNSSTQYHDACTHCQTPDYFISRVCLLLGTTCYKLKKYDESLMYLNWANRNYTKLQENVSLCTGNCVLQGVFHTQLQLYGVKAVKGKHKEAAMHTKNVLEAQEKLMEEGSIGIGQGNMYVYQAYLAAEDFKAALPYCLKALEIYEKHLGSHADVVCEIRKSLRTIYRLLGEGEKVKALEESTSVVKNVGSGYELLMDLGKYEEAIEVLEGEVLRDDIVEDKRALWFISMATAFVKLGRFTDAKKRIRRAKKILEKKGTSPSCFAVGFWEMSCLYEELNDPETALSFVRKAIAVANIPQPVLIQNVTRLFALTLRSRKVKEGIPYLEDAVEKIKDSFGPEHYEVGNGYLHLGLAYWDADQQELGLKFMTNAKDIMDAAFGPNHISSLRTSQTLSMTYGRMGRFPEAVDVQEKVVEGLRGLVLNEQEFVDNAVMILNLMKKGAAASLMGDSPQFNDSEILCETMSKCGISDDRKGN